MNASERKTPCLKLRSHSPYSRQEEGGLGGKEAPVLLLKPSFLGTGVAAHPTCF